MYFDVHCMLDLNAVIESLFRVAGGSSFQRLIALGINDLLYISICVCCAYNSPSPQVVLVRFS